MEAAKEKSPLLEMKELLLKTQMKDKAELICNIFFNIVKDISLKYNIIKVYPPNGIKNQVDFRTEEDPLFMVSYILREMVTYKCYQIDMPLIELDNQSKNRNDNLISFSILLPVFDRPNEKEIYSIDYPMYSFRLEVDAKMKPVLNEIISKHIKTIGGSK